MRHSLDWSVEDQSLYNEVIAGWAKQSTRCKYCLCENHTVEACPEMLLVQLPVSLVPATPASLSESVPNWPSLTQQPNAQSCEVCRKYNKDRCFFRQCRHSHICSVCAGPHSPPLCPQARRDPHPRRGRSNRGAGAP